jgi:microcystin-dependent protein
MPGSWGGDGFRQHGHTDADDGGTLTPSAAVPLIETGDIIMRGTASVRAGFLPCDGAAVSRATYAALFAAIGTTWGVGDGSTTFNVPNLCGRSPLGSGTGSGLTARTIGQTGGEEAHALTSGENGPHGHTATVTDPGHSHSLPLYNGGSAGAFAKAADGTEHTQTSIGSNGTGITVSIANSGSGTAHNTMHPFSVLNFLIKT